MTLPTRILPTLAILTAPLLAAASQCILSGTLSGGTAAFNADFDGDGIPARTGTLTPRGSVFSSVFVALDTLLIGPCPGGFEIMPTGHAVFYSGRDVVFTEVDPSFTLCTGTVETVHLDITGGRGVYAGATGSGTVTIPVGVDTVLSWSPLGAPEAVFTNGARFELRVE
jgi:hypothetical protein